MINLKNTILAAGAALFLSGMLSAQTPATPNPNPQGAGPYGGNQSVAPQGSGNTQGNAGVPPGRPPSVGPQSGAGPYGGRAAVQPQQGNLRGLPNPPQTADVGQSNGFSGGFRSVTPPGLQGRGNNALQGQLFGGFDPALSQLRQMGVLGDQPGEGQYGGYNSVLPPRARPGQSDSTGSRLAPLTTGRQQWGGPYGGYPSVTPPRRGAALANPLGTANAPQSNGNVLFNRLFQGLPTAGPQGLNRQINPATGNP